MRDNRLAAHRAAHLLGHRRRGQALHGGDRLVERLVPGRCRQRRSRRHLKLLVGGDNGDVEGPPPSCGHFGRPAEARRPARLQIRADPLSPVARRRHRDRRDRLPRLQPQDVDPQLDRPRLRRHDAQRDNQVAGRPRQRQRILVLEDAGQPARLGEGRVLAWRVREPDEDGGEHERHDGDGKLRPDRSCDPAGVRAGMAPPVVQEPQRGHRGEADGLGHDDQPVGGGDELPGLGQLRDRPARPSGRPGPASPRRRPGWRRPARSWRPTSRRRRCRTRTGCGRRASRRSSSGRCTRPG